ncbi:TerB family tellurite resistance protein [Pseudorhodobacter antarcticus]|uniref:tellurite resistance TerB family protein n=1 Tax=Pseudorhodobacter antarcticus TaxID=1077947 RepID=UPI000ACC7703|nr:TerB family tellurite resistance protein [Pseudorhodobacter antarcticus]
MTPPLPLRQSARPPTLAKPNPKGRYMFDRILTLFAPVQSYRTPLPPADAQHALGALLVRVAQADRAYLFQEVERIDRILTKRFALSPLDAAKMRAGCERLAAEMPDTDALTAILHEVISQQDREDTLLALWQVVYADGHQHEDENELVTLVQTALGVDAATCARLRSTARAAA